MTVDEGRRLQRVARWHRRLAVLIAVWMAVLATTGFLINHAHGWRLDSTPLPAALQRSVYGIEGGSQVQCAGPAIAGVECADVYARLALPAGALLLAQDSVYLLDGSGQLLEKLTAGQLGLQTVEAGLADGGRIYLQDPRATVTGDSELLNVNPLSPEATEALSGRDWMTRSDRVGTVSWERLLLDLHAARFLGPLASVFNDLMAVLILALALSGSWIYRFKRKSNGTG